MAGERRDYITFLSDYGLADEFVGVCHGVVAQIAPHARILDIAHELPPFDVRTAALVLGRAIQYMPAGIHMAIVDPGVGTKRRAIAVEVDGSVLVGPDNGLLSAATQMAGGALRAVELANPELRIESIGGVTFAGRDIFAPAAAHLANGTTLADFGPEIDPAALVPMLLPLPQVTGDTIAGEVLWVDRFGNCELNVEPGQLAEIGVEPGSSVDVAVGGESRAAVFGSSFEDDALGHLVVLIDSYGFVSLAVNRGRACDDLGVAAGTAVRISKARQ